MATMITLREAAKVIGCSKVTMQHWISEDAPLGAVKKMNKGHKLAWFVDQSKVIAYAKLRGWEC